MSTPIDFIVRQGLQVQTNVVVGSYTLNVATPPTNGLIVSGNVGVGTASPVQKLQVVGNIQITNNASSLSGIYFADGTYQATSAASYSTPAGGPANSVQYNNGLGGFGGSSNFVFSSNFVGIGTSNPAHILDVQSSSSIASFATKTGTDYQIFVGNNTPAGNAAVIGYNNTSEYAYIGTASGVANSNVYILANGNVGIGVSNPASKMDVNGGLSVGSYAGSQSAPTNGLIVSGSVGIGITNPTAKLSIVAGAGQTGLIVSANATAGVFEQFQDSNSNTKFQVDATGNISIGGWTGNVIAANYGGTGQSSFTTGDILYAGSTGSIAALTKLGIGSTGTVLQVNSGIPSWGQVNLASNNVTGILPLANGGTNASSFSSQAIVYTANSTTMTGLVSSVNAAVVFSNTGAPSAVSGGPYTYLSPGAGGGNLSFSKVDLANGVTNTLGAGNGGTGQNTIGQYQLLVGGATNNWNLLSSSATSALVTSVTGSPQWTTGAANTVLRSNGTTITFSQVVLTSDVSGILPYANGGTNANTSWTQGSLIFAGSSSFAQNNAQLYWDNTNNRLGLGTTTPTTTLDVNGAATIRNGANVVAGGMFVQAGPANFASSLIANNITSNAGVNASTLYASTTLNTGGTSYLNALVANTTVQIIGTGASGSYCTGALTVAGGVGVAGNLNVQGEAQFLQNLSILGNLTVGGNIVAVNTEQLNVENPVIGVGTGVEGNALVINDGYDRGLLINYYDNLQNENDYAFLGRQNASGDLIYITNVQPGVQNISNVANPFTTNSPGFLWGSAYFGNITLLGNIASTSNTTGSLVLTGPGGIGVTGNINTGGLSVGNSAFFGSSINAAGQVQVNYLVSNTGISTAQLSASGAISAASIVSNSYINASSINSSGPLSAAGAVTGAGIVSNSYINASSINSSGPLSAAEAITGATLTSNGFIFGTSINTSGTGTFNAVISNSAVQGTSLYSSGAIGADGVITGANLISNSSISGNNLVVSAGISAGNIIVANLIATTSSTTGALIVNGGEAIGGNLWVSGATWLNNVSILSTNTSTSSTTGALIVAGGVGISGNLTVSGNIVGLNFNVTTVTGNSGVFYGNQYGFNALYAGITTGYKIQPQTVEQLSANSDSYAQLNLQNINNGSDASGDIVVTADNGNENNTYIDMGINSSKFATGSIDGPNDGYLQVYGNAITGGGNLLLGTYLANDIIFVTGGCTPANEAGRWRNGQGLIVKTTTVSSSIDTGALVVYGGAGIGCNLYVGGNLVAQSVDATAIGNITPSTGQFTTLIAQNTAKVGILVANTTIQTVDFYASGDINGAGTANFNNLVSNGYVQGTSVYSSGTINAVGAITGASITSNSFVYASALNTSGTATVNNLISNGYVHGTSVYSSGAMNADGAVTAASVVSNTSVTGATVVSNTSITGNSFVMNGNLATISTTGTVTVDTFPTSTYRTVHYLAQITDNTNVGQFHSEQLMILQDGTTAYQTEFNLVFSVQPLGAFSSSISGGVFSLFFTPYAATNKSIRVVRTGVDI
jgi:hypothetical protein